MNNQPDQPLARVYLVGAGPGDPQLLTLRGRDCLARADVVFYDYLVNPQILEHARRGAELVCLGRHGRGRILSQDEINRRVIDEAHAGRTVVRLKAGDPAVFARAAEEVESLVAAGIAFEIVPGITAALAAGSHAGVSLTHRKLASAVAFVTGHEQDDKPAAAIDYAALATFPGTLVFYMGVTSAGAWSAALMAAGKPADTPVAVVRRCSWPDQQTLRGTLGSLAELVASHHLRPPAIVIVGDVVAWDQHACWFTDRPLWGQRVLVTRPAEQAAAARDLLEEFGAQVLLQPAIEILPPEDWALVDAHLARLTDYDWLVFSSANGVRYFLDRMEAGGGDLRRLGPLKLAAMGPGTAEALAKYRLRADLMPHEYRAESLAEALIAAGARRVLLVRASRGREVLAEQLAATGASVDQVVAYRNQDVEQPDPETAAALAEGRVDWITVTSSAIARSLVRLYGPLLAHARLASISPITSATLRELGWQPAAEATEFTLPGLVRAIVAADEQGR
ncbi:MAG TPA: uroporphyrinogen-III C-methyltransferase [Pirellulales bacterium]|jgi:uroporphyrinogen III methyltransferase/synthase|nr:uroporphyrinogen-III C-methyltransferase [Pirellulales bacterium]